MISIINRVYLTDSCSWSCEDVTGDEDNCCEYGTNIVQFSNFTAFDY